MYSDASDYRDLSSSVAYTSDDITWCIASARQVPQWQNMYRIASPLMWFMLVGSGYCAALTLSILLKYEPGTYYGFHTISMCALQSIFGLPTFFNPKNSCVRAYYSTLLFVGVVGINIFLAFVIKFLTVPIYEKQVDSMDEVVSNGYKLCGQNATLSFYNHHQDAVRIAT